LQTARKIAVPGEIVVLSPAGTSYDKFHHFEERGNLFKELVDHLD
jgi:UDP-N-acetylmuramoylalanine--D-glutamate ligase